MQELTFTPSPAVIKATQDEVGQRIVKLWPPEKQAQMAKLWSSFQPIQQANQSIQKQDLNTNNVTDVIAGTLVAAWQEVHQAPDPSVAAVTAVRDQFRKALLSGHSLAPYTDKQKQEAVEELEYVEILHASLQRSARRRAIRRHRPH